MLKRTVVIFAAAAFLGGAVPTHTAQAGDDIWDLMNPAWWADEIFDNDDDWWYYQHHRYSPYWGGPYRRHPQVIVIQPELETNEENSDTPDTHLPE